MNRFIAALLIVSAVWLPGPTARGDDANWIKVLPAPVQAAIESGNFREAETLLRVAAPDTDGPVVSPEAIALENLRRIRMDYALTPRDMVVKLRQTMPDATGEDVDRWCESGLLQHRVIDGSVCIFKREPSNLYRRSADARARRVKGVAAAGGDFDLTEHIVGLLDLADRTAGSKVYPVDHEVTYRLRVKEGHPRVKPGAVVRAWLPAPQAYRQQGDVAIALAPQDVDRVEIAPSGAAHRTVYFERTVVDPAKPVEFKATYTFRTWAYCPKLDPSLAQAAHTGSFDVIPHLGPRPPHIVITPEIERIAKQACGDEANPLLRARKLYRWVCENISYCAEMEYSTIANLPAKALKSRSGDCGVQALTFITLCRAAGIPARWQSGWESLPNRPNMHDWCEFYVAPWGWLPADPSYGLQDHPDPRVQEFYCGSLDAYRMIVNLDYGQPLRPAKTSYRSEPNDFQRGEIEIDGHNLYFDEWSWDFEVRTVPRTRDLRGTAEALEAIVPDLLREGNIPGAVIAVGRKAEDGYETWRKAFGYLQTDPEPVPMPENAIFDMASMTKPIATGTSLMVLIEQGKVALDDPVGKYLPEFREGDKQGVTVRHLMTHMSGMPSYLSGKIREELRAEHGFPCRDATRKAIRTLPLPRPPGEAVVYSCLNAILSAEIVEAVSGVGLDMFASAHVFRKLGMADTGFGVAKSEFHRAAPTTKTDYGVGSEGFLLGQVHDPVAAYQGGVSGNAGLFSTTADIERYAQMLLSGGAYEGGRVLKPDTVQQMTTVQNAGAVNAKGLPDRRGLLWDIYYPAAEDRGVDALYAFGHTGYTGTAIRVYPDQGVYVIALTNRVHPDDKAQVGAFRKAVWRTVGEALMGVSSETRPAEAYQGEAGSISAAP